MANNKNNKHPLARNQRMIEEINRRMSLKRQGLPQDINSAKGLEQVVDEVIPNGLIPGNVGAINRIIWPFWFTFSAPELPPNVTSQGFTTITQEAAFVWMAYTKSVFTVNAGVYTYVDPEQAGANGSTYGLKFSVRDSQSTRVFHNTPLDMDMIGSPQYPSVLPTPMMFLPNSNIEITYANENATTTYVPFITFFGYRIRIDNAQDLLSTVVG
jgi:hypothetical protein